MKRVSYMQVRISCLGGVIEFAPSTDGWSASFEKSGDHPKCGQGYGKTIEEAGQQMLGQLKHLINAVEEDLKAFVERNK